MSCFQDFRRNKNHPKLAELKNQSLQLLKNSQRRKWSYYEDKVKDVAKRLFVIPLKVLRHKSSQKDK